MKQKTVVQKLIEKFDRCNGQLIREDIEEALLFERHQIREAYDAGVTEHCRYEPERHGNEHPTAIDYYKNKYQSNETN